MPVRTFIFFIFLSLRGSVAFFGLYPKNIILKEKKIRYIGISDWVINVLQDNLIIIGKMESSKFTGTRSCVR